MFTIPDMRTNPQALKIQYHLRLAGLNQTQLAEELGINRSMVSRVVNGYGYSRRVKALIIQKLQFNPWQEAEGDGTAQQS